ncbi:MAG: transposase, partial [Nakamurella sp.]
IDLLDHRIEGLIADMPGGQSPDEPPEPSEPGASPRYLAAVDRLDEIAGIGPRAAQVIIAEIGLSMAVFPTPGHLVSWAKLAPRTIQSGAMRRKGRTGHGNSYRRSVLGEAAIAASRTDTFLGARYRRLVKRIGKAKALVAVARSVLVIIWHLLNDATSRFHDLGPEFFNQHTNTERRTRNHVRQLETLGYTVTLTPAAA